MNILRIHIETYDTIESIQVVGNGGLLAPLNILHNDRRFNDHLVQCDVHCFYSTQQSQLAQLLVGKLATFQGRRADSKCHDKEC